MSDDYLSVLPEAVARAILALPASERSELREIRLRCGRPVRYLALGPERALPGSLLADAGALREIVNRATGYSAYAAGAQLKQGFLTLPGGHRLGLCGQAVMGPEGIRTIRELSSINLRIARQRPGCGTQALLYLRAHPGSTLIAGPPGCGKTTLLRELIRDRSDHAMERVGVVDERMELAACRDGRPDFCVGQMTDVLSGVPKRDGLLMLLRTMSPDWIAVDEITDERDLDDLLRASFCGVRLLATAHVFTSADLDSRPLYAKMCAMGLFENLILMDPKHAVTTERMKHDDQISGGGADRHGSQRDRLSYGAQRPA